MRKLVGFAQVVLSVLGASFLLPSFVHAQAKGLFREGVAIDPVVDIVADDACRRGTKPHERMLHRFGAINLQGSGRIEAIRIIT